MAADVTADAYYAIVPEWVLDAGVSGNAVKLYAILRRYADKSSQTAHPSRKTLSERMGFTRVASVDPIISELVTVGAVTTFERWTTHGDRDSNGYHVKTARPGEVVRHSAPQVVRESGPGVVRETVHKPQSLEPQSEEPQNARKRAVALPASFPITDEMRAWARENTPAVDVDSKLSEWMDYWRGVGRPMKDWVAVWRNGMRKQQEFAERDARRKGPDDWMTS